MTEPSVQALLARCPAWFTVTCTTASSVEGIAYAPGTRWKATGVALCIVNFPQPTAAEQVPGTVFPARCPERHIQHDQTFCLGLRYLTITGPESADQWWVQLEQFLKCQSVAEAAKVWPPAHALDHGTAGASHERALAIACQLGIEEEYAAARLDEPSWITDPKLRLLGKNDVPINGRAPCPRGCRRRCMTKGRSSRPMLRRACEHRALLLELVVLERKRRSALAQYWKWVRSQGTICCGRMLSCELKK